ncbi:MAG: carboxypeptidase-like regulatory domain-containing protein [Acidobacteriota bacterium]
MRSKLRLSRIASFTLALIATAAAHAQNVNSNQDMRGSSVAGSIGDRDNSRVQGTVFDSSGSPMSDVQIWAMNHNSPADRIRARTRKTGTYLLRNFERIYTRDDVYGVTMRVQFEKAGYQTVEVVADVEKNGLTRVFPVLYADGEQVGMTGVCAMLTGRITNAKGKGVKGSTVKVSGDGFSAEVAAAKNGEYELLLWNAPAQVTLEIESAQGTASQPLELTAAPRADVFLTQVVDVTL